MSFTTLQGEAVNPGEEVYGDSIIASFDQQMRDMWKPGQFERGGNTKTHGIVRGEFRVHDNLAPELRHGIYAQPRTFRAWVRFSGPGPYITPAYSQNTRAIRRLRLSSMMNVLPCAIDSTGHAFWPL